MNKSLVLTFCIIGLANSIFGQQVTCFSQIENYQLKERLIKAQKLQIWPSIIDTLVIQNQESIQDTVLLYFTTQLKSSTYKTFLRATKTSCLKRFSQMAYTENCNQQVH